MKLLFENWRRFANTKLKLKESFAPLMQSNDLDAINQAIDLAISMEEFPEPDKVKYVVGQSGPEWGRIYVQYEGKNSPAGDAFEEWLKQYITSRDERVQAGWDDVGDDIWYSRFESDNRGGRSVFTIQLPDHMIKLARKDAGSPPPINESLESLLQSDDLANVNQGIELAAMMGDIPEPDHVRTYSDAKNKLLIKYKLEEDGDKFIKWLEQNGILHEEDGEVYAGKPFYSAVRGGYGIIPGHTRIRIHIATEEEGWVEFEF